MGCETSRIRSSDPSPPARISARSPRQVGSATAAGNLAMQSLLRGGQVRAKLEVGGINDPEEHQADVTADRVMRSADGVSCSSCGQDGSHQDEHLRRMPVYGASATVPRGREANIRGLSGHGEGLSPPLRSFFEPRLGRDLSDVRVHRNAAAAESAQSLGARAYTFGSDIAFASGQWQPDTQAGKHLIAHELAHVAQNGRTLRRQPVPGTLGPAGPAQETSWGWDTPGSRMLQGAGINGEPLDRFRDADVPVASYEDIARTVTRLMQAPAASRGAGRADFNRDPKIARANLYHTNFRDDHERLSYAYGVMEEFAGFDPGPDTVFKLLVDYEVSWRRANGEIVAHQEPTQGEVHQLEQRRGQQEATRAREWEAGARAARNLFDVTQLATPARSHADPLVQDQFEPRRPLSGSVPGYRVNGSALEPLDLLASSDFRAYATQWEQAHSGILAKSGLAPVVSTTPISSPLTVMPSAYTMIGYIGYVTADSIYLPEDIPVSSGDFTETLMAAVESGQPVFAYNRIGKALEKSTGYGGKEYLVSTDTNGRVLQIFHVSTKDEPPIESVASPIDFFGPALVSRAFAVGSELFEMAVETLPKSLPFRGALASLGRKGVLSLKLAMAGTGELPALAMEETPAFVAREGAQAADTAAATARWPSQPTFNLDPRTTEDVFGEISQELGLEAPGTVRYPSTAAAAAGAQAAGLRTPTRPGFQTHSTAASVRRALGLSGLQWQSVHMVFQAAYRALRARGYVRPGGGPYSAGRALTTVDLPLAAHRAFDAGWVPLWNAAMANGQTITAGQAYQWLSNAINAVNPSLISDAVKGAMLDRIRTELFVELGLNWNDPISP